MSSVQPVGRPLTHEVEARQVLDTKVQELRALGYERLRAMNSTRFNLYGGRVQLGGGPSELVEVHGPSGTLYQLETEVMWDDRKGGVLRVIVRLLEECEVGREISDEFLIAPSGGFPPG